VLGFATDAFDTPQTAIGGFLDFIVLQSFAIASIDDNAIVYAVAMWK
jgi:hypothetical protein